MKTTLLLLIASSLVLTAPLTPNTHLPSHLKETLENTLQIYQVLGSANRRINHAVSPYFTVANLRVASDFINTELPWLNAHSKKAILDDIKNTPEAGLNSHFVSQGNDQGRSEAVINIAKEDGALKIVISKETLKTGRRAGIPTYHEKRSSLIGFPLSSPEQINVEKFDSNQMRFFENSRLRLLREVYERVGSRHSGMLGVNVLDAVQAVVGAWQAIADNFKTTESTTLKNITRGKGFSQYKAESVVFKNEGVRFSMWHLYQANFPRAIGISSYPEIASKTSGMLELAMMLSDFQVGVNDMVFDTEKNGECASVVFFAQKDEMAQKMHLVAAVTKGAFKLSPDVYIYEYNLSAAGGIYQEQKERREYKARDLTEGDIKAITALASLNAINKFTEFFKIDFKLPTDNPTDFCKK